MSLEPKYQEVRVIICSGLEIKNEPERYVANLFLADSEPEASNDAVFGRVRRRMAKTQRQHQHQHQHNKRQVQEWPVMLRISGPSSIEELFCHSPLTKPRFAATDVLVFVLSTKTLTDFEHLGGLIVGEDDLVLDAAASPQLQRVLVAIYSNASQDSWAVKEDRLHWLASALHCELRVMSEEDVERAKGVLDEAAGKVVLWRALQE